MQTKKIHSVVSNCKTKIREINSSFKKKYLSKQHKYFQSRLQLKDLRIVLHDIATNDLIPPHQKYLITKRNNFGKIIDNSKENGNKKISKNKQIDPKERSSIKKKKKEKRKKVKRQLFNVTNPSCTKEQQTFSVKPLYFNHNDDIKEYDFNINDNYKCTEKYSNIDTCIVKINSDRDYKNELKKEDLKCEKDPKINFFNNESFMKNEHSDKIMHSKFSKTFQNLPFIFENFNEINLPKYNEVSVIPKIINDHILHKNKVIVIKDPNNLHHKDYSRMIKNIEINKPYSVELSNEVAELTVDNLHKFTKNYQENHQQIQINGSVNATDISSLNSINNMDKDMMQKMSENNSIISYTKRKWFSQNGVTQFNQTNKKFKLDRSFVKNKSLSVTNNFLYVNENSNPTIKYDNVNINANAIQDIDNNVTSSSNNHNDDNNNDNTLCKVQLIQESSEIYCDTNKNLSNSSKTICNLENEKNELKLIKEYGTNVEHFGEDNLLKYEISTCSTELDYQKKIGNKTQDDSDDDDCISIYSNTSLILDEILMSSYKNIRTNKCEKNKTSPNTLDTNKQHKNLECVKALDTIAKSDIPLNSKLTNLQNTSEYKETQRNNASSMKTISTYTNKSIISNNNRKSNLINNDNKNSLSNDNCNVYSTNTFSDDENIIEISTKVQLWSYDMHRQYCFQIMKDSFCRDNMNKKCLLKHELQELINYTIINYKEHLTNILFHLCSLRYTYLLGELYIQIIDELNIISILSIYKEFYLQERPYLQFVYATVQALLKKGMNPKCIINELCQIHYNDKLTLHYILISMKQRIKSSEYWDVLSTLFEFIKPDKKIIERILNNCIVNRKHVQDVNINLIQKLHPDEINQLDENLMSSFNSLILQHQCKNINNNLSSCTVDSNKILYYSSLHEFEENYNERFSDNSCMSCPVNDLSQKHCLYRTLHNLKTKLLFGDYDYIINTLTTYKKANKDEILCYYYCFQIFCKEINCGEYYVSETIKHAVKIGANNEIINVLVDIAIYILMKLVINEIWILAYKLLKTLQICFVNYDATFLLLSAEIYLANNQVNKAFVLLKESNIISSNHQDWNVVSKPEDCSLRTKIIQILLDALCKESSENAFFMFQFLAKDQNNNYEPIDLSQYVDKLMLIFLSTMKIELVAAMGSLIIKYNFAFTNTIVYRAAIKLLFHSNIMLAKRLYQYASGLGIYESIELSPVIHIIININWVKEELYLIFWDFFQRFSLSIRRSTNQIIPKDLCIYIIFQELSTETHPYVKQCYDPMIKINRSQKLVRHVLDTWFDPSLTSTLKLNGNVMQLNCSSVLNYLKLNFDYKI